jgi:hypothetical protein
MRGTIKNSGCVSQVTFNALRNRDRNNRLSKKPYVVRSVTKAGTISKMKTHDMNYCATIEAAEARKLKLEELNPGSIFVVCEA